MVQWLLLLLLLLWSIYLRFYRLLSALPCTLAWFQQQSVRSAEQVLPLPPPFFKMRKQTQRKVLAYDCTADQWQRLTRTRNSGSLTPSPALRSRPPPTSVCSVGFRVCAHEGIKLLLPATRERVWPYFTVTLQTSLNAEVPTIPSLISSSSLSLWSV